MSMTSLALSFSDIFPWPWIQIPALLILVAIIVGWMMYRKKQM